MCRVVVAAALLLLLGGIPAASVTAQDRSLLDLLPTAADVGPDFVVVDNRTRTLAEQATGFANADEAARLLADWAWQENAFQVFQTTEPTSAGAPSATLDISLTRFANAEGAAMALPYFLSDRAAVLSHYEVKSQNLIPQQIGDETRVLSGPVEGGDDTTLYVRTGALLLRLSLTATSDAPAISPEELARAIVNRATAQSPSSSLTVMQPAAMSLLDTLPLDHAACFSVEGEGEMDVPAVVERLATDTGASTALQDLGWQGGVYRQFACKPPAGRVGWVDISVHRFPDALSATEAVAYFAASRAESMDLQSVPATMSGDSSTALTGRAVNGTEYSLYLSEGPLLYAVTGVAPDSGSDPRVDVEAIATALLASPSPVQVDELPAASEVIPPTTAPIPTATPLPTLVPIPVPTSTPVPPPTATPVPTAAPPMLAAIPTATPVPTLPPPPTVAPTPIPTVMLPAAPPPPTATTGPLPTATPRVIHRPTP
ncbi:MAG TPA: hypothetical protein VHG52_05250 [Thermomicrobiales bacterium]|nr:hypothetical protein [Thermomicrobiales bacterium]